MNIVKTYIDGAVVYVGGKDDVKALAKKLVRKGKKLSHRKFPSFSPCKFIYALYVKDDVVKVVSGERMLLFLLEGKLRETVFEEYGTLSVIAKPLSIFDKEYARCRDSRGKYYCLLRTNNGYTYCVRAKNMYSYLKKGGVVEKRTRIYGERVRPMNLFDQGKCILDDSDVDFWGNVRS